MPLLNAAERELSLKIVLAGVPFAGKEEMLRDFSARFGQADLKTTHIGDSRILSAAMVNRVPNRPDWILRMSLHTVAGHADYNAITELLLEDIDGLVFVCPIQSQRTEELKESLQSTLFNLRRRAWDLNRLPFVMHYREHEVLPGFEIPQLERFLGIEPNSLPTFYTAQDERENWSDSISFVLSSALEQVEFPSEG